LCRRVRSSGGRFVVEGLAAFESNGDERLEGASRMYLALTHCETGDLAAAERDARRAVELLAVAPWLLVYARAALAHVLLAVRRAEEALREAEASDRQRRELGFLEEGESFVLLVWARALEAAGRSEDAREALAEAAASLLERADRIQDPAWRRSFLEQVPDNAQTIALARRLGVSVGTG
jgi:ATP/maltotriose-dependent transcriptional regulator MalT